MNVSKEKIYNVLEMDLPEKDWLYEIKLQIPERSWTYADVKTFLQLFSEYEEYEYLPPTDTLHVTLQNTLLEITDTENISYYCNYEDFSVPHQWFESFIVAERTIAKEYNLSLIHI